MLNVYILVFTALSIASINAFVIAASLGGMPNDKEGQTEPQNGTTVYPSTEKRQKQPRKGLNAPRTKTYRDLPLHLFGPDYYEGYYPYYYNYYNSRYNAPRLEYTPKPPTTGTPYRRKPIVRVPDVTMSSNVQQEIEGSSTVAPFSESNRLIYILIAAGSFVGLVFLFAMLVKLRSRSKKRAEKMEYSRKQIGIQYGKDISFSGGFKCENSLKAKQVNSLKFKLTRAESKPSLPPLPPIPLLPGQIKMQQETVDVDPIEETLE